jgi:hypothetical protein
MKTSRVIPGILLIALGLCVQAPGLLLLADDGTFREVGRTTERELNVVLSSSFGGMFISKGPAEKIMSVDRGADENESPGINIEYSIRNRVGYADISLGGEHKEGEHKRGWFNTNSFRGDRWSLRFSDAIPISFDIELGVGKAQLDLSGLQVKDFNLSTGASEVDLSFDQPNKSSIDNMNIESGVSKFTGRNLGNANFKHFKFQGGVGSYTLDFSGKLENEVDVDVEVGLGVVTIVVPENVGAKVIYEKNWVSRLDCDHDFHLTGEDQYVSDNYSSSSAKMNITVQSGLGSVKIRR